MWSIWHWQNKANEEDMSINLVLNKYTKVNIFNKKTRILFLIISSIFSSWLIQRKISGNISTVLAEKATVVKLRKAEFEKDHKITNSEAKQHNIESETISSSVVLIKAKNYSNNCYLAKTCKIQNMWRCFNRFIHRLNGINQNRSTKYVCSINAKLNPNTIIWCCKNSKDLLYIKVPDKQRVFDFDSKILEQKTNKANWQNCWLSKISTTVCTYSNRQYINYLYNIWCKEILPVQSLNLKTSSILTCQTKEQLSDRLKMIAFSNHHNQIIGTTICKGVYNLVEISLTESGARDIVSKAITSSQEMSLCGNQLAKLFVYDFNSHNIPIIIRNCR